MYIPNKTRYQQIRSSNQIINNNQFIHIHQPEPWFTWYIIYIITWDIHLIPPWQGLVSMSNNVSHHPSIGDMSSPDIG